jgi:hypothetical protein
MGVLFVVTPSFAEQSFSEPYERDYNIFNPASQCAPDNPLNPANRSRSSPGLEQMEMIPGA